MITFPCLSRQSLPGFLAFLIFDMCIVSAEADQHPEQNEYLEGMRLDEVTEAKGWSRRELEADIKEIRSEKTYQWIEETKHYRNEDEAITFAYPANLFLQTAHWDKDKPQHVIDPPVLFFKADGIRHTRGGGCSLDCITISNHVAEELPIPEEKPSQIYDYYYFYDEHSTHPFEINGLKAWHAFVIADVEENIGGMRIGFSLQERIYIQDPVFYKKWIYLQYYERLHKRPKDLSAFTSEDIKNFFNAEQYKAFQAIVKSFKRVPFDATELRRYQNETLGLTFRYPQFWGYISELKSKGPVKVDAQVKQAEDGELWILESMKMDKFYQPVPNKPTLRLSMRSPFGLGELIEFAFPNQQTPSSYSSLSPETLVRYDGQSFEQVCEDPDILNVQFFDIDVAECRFQESAGGIPYVILEGKYTPLFNMYSLSLDQFQRYDVENRISTDGWEFTPIPLEERNRNAFKAAMIRTQSDDWPVFVMYTTRWFYDWGLSEAAFDQLISSLSKIENAR